MEEYRPIHPVRSTYSGGLHPNRCPRDQTAASMHREYQIFKLGAVVELHATPHLACHHLRAHCPPIWTVPCSQTSAAKPWTSLGRPRLPPSPPKEPRLSSISFPRHPRLPTWRRSSSSFHSSRLRPSSPKRSAPKLVRGTYSLLRADAFSAFRRMQPPLSPRDLLPLSS